MADYPTSPGSNGGNRRGLTPSVSSPLNPSAFQQPSSSSRPPAVPFDQSSGSSGENVGTSSRSRSSSRPASVQLDAASVGILTGAVGGNFGPFPRSSTYNSVGAQGPWNRRDSMASSDVAIDLGNGERGYMPTTGYRYSTASQSEGSLANMLGPESPNPDASSKRDQNTALLWDKENAEADDYLHDPDPELDRMLDKQWAHHSARGWLNVSVLVVLIVVLVGLFAGWPIYNYAIRGGFPSGSQSGLGWNIGGINGSGQVPQTGLPSLIDKDTPQSAMTRTGFDGERYNLVFSDEFNEDGRTFWPGDDPFWEAVDLHYWFTTDLEWYDPDAITTRDGKLVITITEEPIHNLGFRSGMLQSWNKFCFTGGYIEVSLSFPGTARTQGYWPAAWTLGNLARPGYGGTTDGMWPYSYDSCDVGTLPNQTWPNGTDPYAAKHSGSRDYGGELSWLPGQRASACTCAGEDHPGPLNSKGRGAPEIDITEQQVDTSGVGSASQSIQFAPMDPGYLWRNTTPYISVQNPAVTTQNVWKGSITQESASLFTLTDATSYGGNGYSTFGFEYDPGADGRITWDINGTETWEMTAAAMAPNAETGIGQRTVAEEPMSIVLNLALSTKFQEPVWSQLFFPTAMYVDYVRVYQKGKRRIGCDPPDYPTHDYIQRHLDVYSNPNITQWTQGVNSTWPKNSLSRNGCN